MRDPGMRVGRLTAEELRARITSCGSSRWCDGSASVTEAYAGSITIADILDGKYLNVPLGNEADAPLDQSTLSELIFTVLDPNLLGEKVFRLTLADMAETNLEDFEASEFNSPEPREMVEGIRAFVFGKITSAELSDKIDAAYLGENSRADVIFYGKLAASDLTNFKVWNDFVSGIYVRIQQTKTLEQIQRMLDRIKEYDRGTVDLTDVISVRP